MEKRRLVLLIVVAILGLIVFLFYFDILNLYPDNDDSELKGELSSLWSGNPLSKVNVSIVNPKCSSYSLTYKSGCLNMGHCLCDDFYNQCYSIASKYRDKDFATCRSRTFPATINGKYFKTLIDCENAVISATYTDRNNCKISYGWYENVNNCYNAIDGACKKVFGY
ncbi:MAG: hypothetical protein Q8N63_05790 [Nanoarchaeota archaeon]|nr:hypothetical protein [Nanoarchaeota archaeon]